MRRSIEEATAHLPYRCSAHASGEEFLEAVDPRACGCVVLELRLPGMGGLEVLRAIQERELPLRAVLLTAHADVHVAVSAMKLGATDVLEKPFRAQALLDALYAAMLSARELCERLEQRRDLQERFERLTERERQVVAGLAAGMTSKAIAARLEVTSQAVDARRANAMGKLAVTNLAELVHSVLLYRALAVAGPDVAEPDAPAVDASGIPLL